MQPKLAEHLNLVPPSRLFHYTSTDAFRCIVENKNLWATDVFYMNDHEEILHAIRLCQQACISLALSKNGRERQFLKALSDALDFQRTDRPHIFAVSFSASRDQLSQWRAYTKNGGYALAFCAEALSSIANAQRYRLVQCIYQHLQKMAIVEEFVNTRVEKITCDEVDCSLLAEIAANEFLEIAAMMKHQGFSEEREWRLISVDYCQNSGHIKYRSTSKYLVPYVEVGIGGDVISPLIKDSRDYIGLCEVLVGPAPEPELSWRSCMQLLINRNVYFEQITPSGIPYRAG